jgi:hypothetical protein
MNSVHDQLRERLLARAGLSEAPKKKVMTWDELNEEVRTNTWSEKFAELMFNRLLMGFLRYGPKRPNAPRYDYLKAVREKLELYEQTGNDELLVDIGNYAMLEFRHGDHPLKHFDALDDKGGHAVLKT